MKMMKHKYICLIFLCLYIFVGSTKNAYAYGINVLNNQENLSNYNITMKRDLLCLMMAYPEHIVAIEKNSEDYVYIITRSGKKIIYDDKKKKSFQDKLLYPDLQDMMEQVYPLGSIDKLMDEEFDPGRARVYALLKDVYGVSKEQVQSNLTRVKVGYKYWDFNGENGAAESLKQVMKELIPIAEKRNDVCSYVFPTSGTFNYRYIAGTNQLSAHSFGTAIDLRSDKRDYWKWTSRKEGERRMLSYPREIIEIFEKNNFIWGGKWGHFDILHFEYRPELIIKAKYFSNQLSPDKPWYSGIPCEDAKTKSFIQIIEEELK